MMRPRTGEREFFELLETQLSQSLYPTEGEDVVEPRNIEEEIDLVESTAKEAGVLRQAEEDEEEKLWSEEDDDEEHISDTPQVPRRVNSILVV